VVVGRDAAPEAVAGADGPDGGSEAFRSVAIEWCQKKKEKILASLHTLQAVKPTPE